MLNTQSPIPLYRQLAEWLMARIRDGEYIPGNKIPSEHQLAATFNIGRPTARQAVDFLVRKGMLIRRRGAGTFVCETQQEVDLFSLDGTSASFRKEGVVFETRVITPVHLRTDIDDTGHPFQGRSAFFLVRLTLVDQVPILIEDLYLDATLFAGLDHIEIEDRSLSDIAEEQFYLQPISGKQSFDIGYPDRRRGRYLDIPTKTPVLVVKRCLHFPQMVNGVFCQLWCRTDQFVFTQHIGGTPHA